MAFADMEAADQYRLIAGTPKFQKVKRSKGQKVKRSKGQSSIEARKSSSDHASGRSIQNFYWHEMSNIQDQDYAPIYRHFFNEAIGGAPSFGMNRPLLINQGMVHVDTIDMANAIFLSRWEFLLKGLPSYIGDHCIQLSSRIFVMLNHYGIPAEIAIGTVRVHGDTAYSGTPASLRREAENPGDENPMPMHAWVTLSSDTIIDATMGSYLVANFGAPAQYKRQPFVSHAGLMGQDGQLQYHPMLVGSEYIGMTNPPDPRVLLEQLRNLQPQRKLHMQRLEAAASVKISSLRTIIPNRAAIKSREGAAQSNCRPWDKGVGSLFSRRGQRVDGQASLGLWPPATTGGPQGPAPGRRPGPAVFSCALRRQPSPREMGPGSRRPAGQ